jgi:hypothetical protein
MCPCARKDGQRLQRGGIVFKRGVMDGDTEHDEGFDLGQARLPDFYPADNVLVEMGPVAIAATRVDSQLALLLLTVKYSSAVRRHLQHSSGKEGQRGCAVYQTSALVTSQNSSSICPSLAAIKACAWPTVRGFEPSVLPPYNPTLK